MSSPDVGQLAVLDRLLHEALERYRPRDLLLPGCSTGNGLAHVNPLVTRLVTGVDINPEYLARLTELFPHPGFELTLQCADVTAWEFPLEAFDLAHCALLFEYVDWPPLIGALAGTIRRGGGLSVVLQRPSDVSPAVSPTAYASLRRLDSLFHFVEPAALIARARSCGFILEAQRVEPLPSGKGFDVLQFSKPVSGWRSRP